LLVSLSLSPDSHAIYTLIHVWIAASGSASVAHFVMIQVTRCGSVFPKSLFPLKQEELNLRHNTSFQNRCANVEATKYHLFCEWTVF